MVVGFDTRFLSDRYAGEVARVLAGNGYTVYLTQGDAPTPAISYTVHHMGAIAGISSFSIAFSREAHEQLTGGVGTD